ncbi:hypothetical protein ABIB73_006507 [Bradyrhizobium sp. F1.4.3]|uniref:hypothetical protein n=1 Tax=Bradyrhizobium sp. F1.4.3 TaxID=3156356 RepID=UPI003393E162
MKATVTIHSVFVTAKLARLASNRREDVLHCDKVSWFRHNQAAPVRLMGFGCFLARAISGSNGLSLGGLLG